MADELSAAQRGLSITKALEALLPWCGDKRALSYLDGKGNEVRDRLWLIWEIRWIGWGVCVCVSRHL